MPTRNLEDKQISKEGINFIEKLLPPRPQKRMSAFEALDHGWPQNNLEVSAHSPTIDNSDTVQVDLAKAPGEILPKVRAKNNDSKDIQGSYAIEQTKQSFLAALKKSKLQETVNVPAKKREEQRPQPLVQVLLRTWKLTRRSLCEL